MTGKSTVRQLEERHVASKVELMVWCSKIDLLAVANVRGEVALHRLTWQKVWTLAPPSEKITVRGIAWRPDGKVIAIAYSTNNILLVDVENKETLHTTHMEAEITCISWIQEKDNLYESKPGHFHKVKPVSPKYFFDDNTGIYLPKLPGLSRSFATASKHFEENTEDSKKIRDQTHLNVLLVGLATGNLYLSVFGLFPCGVLNLPEHIGNGLERIVGADISDDLHTLHVLVLVSKKNHVKIEELRLFVFDTPVLANRALELHSLALKHGQIVSLMNYLAQTMLSIKEAWETILLEMDCKLNAFAAKVPQGSVSADFLDLLMFGVPSAELETFLLKDLTEKGLKKLGHTIELSYTNIQKLVLKHLQSVCQSLSYHLSELRGMARWEDRYFPLGINEKAVEDSVSASGSFLGKATEVLQVIDCSMKNYKAFFRWLYVVILRITEERVPPEITKISQQDLTYISGFLKNFDNSPASESERQVFALQGNMVTPRKLQFSLEMLGQYLLEQSLAKPFDMKPNPWQKFLVCNSYVNTNTSIVTQYRQMSLFQQHCHLETSVEMVFSLPNKWIGKLFSVTPDLGFVSIPKSGHGNLSYVKCPIENKLLFAFLDSNTSSPGFYFLEVPLDTSSPRKCANVYFDFLAKKGEIEVTPSEAAATTLKVIDVQFYQPTSLSVLLLEVEGENRCTTFVQIPTHIIMKKSEPVDLSCAPRVEVCALLEHYAFKPVDNMVACRFAVSGSRKVAVILSESLRKVRLFEMEAEEEEEDDDIMESTVSSSSMLNTPGSKFVPTNSCYVASAMEITGP